VSLVALQLGLLFDITLCFLIGVFAGGFNEASLVDLIGLAFLASAALTCAGVLRTCALFEEELLALLFVSSLGSSAPPIDPGPFFFVVGVFNLGGPLNDEGVEAADVVFFSYID